MLYSFVAKNLTLYDRCLQIWLSYLPGSCFYQDFLTVFDWSDIEDGNFIPKGVPLSPQKCSDRFYEILDKMEFSALKLDKFNEKTFELVVEILKIGKSAFPGLVTRQPDLDLFVQAILKSALVETIDSFVRGRGKIMLLEQIWRELKEFGKLSIIRDPNLTPRPLTAVYTVEPTPGSSIQMLDLTYTAGEDGPKTRSKAAVKINIQTRSLVSHMSNFYEIKNGLMTGIITTEFRSRTSTSCTDL